MKVRKVLVRSWANDRGFSAHTRYDQDILELVGRNYVQHGPFWLRPDSPHVY